MRTYFYTAIISLLLVASCNNKNKEKRRQLQ